MIFNLNPVTSTSTLYSVNETILVNTSCQNEFVSIVPGENVMTESLTIDKF